MVSRAFVVRLLARVSGVPGEQSGLDTTAVSCLVGLKPDSSAGHGKRFVLSLLTNREKKQGVIAAEPTQRAPL
jgi:hypothetical protein